MEPITLWYGAAAVGLCVVGLLIFVWSMKAFGNAHRISKTKQRILVSKVGCDYGCREYKEEEWPAGGYLVWACILLAASIACFIGSYTVYFEYVRQNHV